MTNTYAFYPAVLFGLAAATAGCGGTEPADFEWPSETPDAVQTYAQIVEATYADTVAEATALDRAVQALVAGPSETTLAAARAAWRASREPYLQSEVFRFYDGPIDDPATGPEGLINAWPLDEHYIDYVQGDASAGIINADDPIEASALEALNEAGGEKNIATGYHAIEFLLWGQDHSPTGPGQRPHTDYLSPAGAPNSERRAQYLSVASELLLNHLKDVHNAWLPGADYRTQFESEPEAAVKKLLTGMIVLSGFETGGERLQAALDSGDQEDEHSCFSDNTHRDMIQDIQGVQNVWRGRYVRVDGSVVEGRGVQSIVQEVDPGLAAELDARIQTSLDLAEALIPPFDQEILPGSPGVTRVRALVESLKAQERVLFRVFEALNLTVQIPEA